MKAIFDRNCNCVGWYNESSQMVFDTETRWIGFVNQSYFFSSHTNWLGALINGTLVDRSGKPVAWVQGYCPRASARLQCPVTPLRPLRPLTPMGAGQYILGVNILIKNKTRRVGILNQELWLLIFLRAENSPHFLYIVISKTVQALQ